MSSRTTMRPVIVLNAASMATNQTSAVTVMQSLTKLSYALAWSGSTPVGTVSIQGSNDYSLNGVGATSNAGTWTTLTVSYNGNNVTSIAISGNTGNGVIDINNTSLYAIRLVYTAGSGTGNITAVANGKVS